MQNYTWLENIEALIPEITEDSIVSRTVFDDDSLKAVLFGFAAGQSLSEHTASQPATLHILRGEAHITLGEDAYDAKAGAWVHMPARLPHSVEAKTEVIMLLLLIKGAGN